jgi:hypothetical protein
VLRIRGSVRGGQEVRVRAPRCTIGAAPGCTLRLMAPGVQPVHCLVIRGSQSTVVRRLHDDTRLNGSRFGDASLSAGDLLAIGSIELEVVAPTNARHSETAQPGGAELLNRCLRVEAEAAELRRQREQLHAELAAERGQREEQQELRYREAARAEEQFQRQRVAWERRNCDAERELAEREARSANLAIEQTEQAIALDAQRHALAALQETCAARQRSLELEEAELGAVHAELDALRQELAWQQSHAEHRGAELATRHTELEIEARQTAEQRRILDEAAMQLQTGRAALADERQRLSMHQAEFAAQRLAWEEKRQAQMELNPQYQNQSDPVLTVARIDGPPAVAKCRSKPAT